MWSSTAFTKFGSLPSGKKAWASATYSVITILGGVFIWTISAAADRKSDRKVGSIRAIGQ